MGTCAQTAAGVPVVMTPSWLETRLAQNTLNYIELI